ncbi:hypothetical protein SDC9_91764 [bioreactor metagenome]|uniref:Uncharacterized protein n=1 Tax=bioreactor metagenome TaxID=1076179 RepID=A0A644ZVR3_9ZZZZ
MHYAKNGEKFNQKAANLWVDRFLRFLKALFVFVAVDCATHANVFEA